MCGHPDIWICPARVRSKYAFLLHLNMPQDHCTFGLLQNSASPSSRGRLLYIHPVVVGCRRLSSRFVTINSTSIKPSMKVSNVTYVHHIILSAPSEHNQCIISASLVHNQCIIMVSSGPHQDIIRASSEHHQHIISKLSAHHQRIIRAS